LPAALALFDQYGSATDAAGHHYEGGAGLTEFLLASGFATPDAHITTQNLHIVANRAVWTNACSCGTGSTLATRTCSLTVDEVRLMVRRGPAREGRRAGAVSFLREMALRLEEARLDSIWLCDQPRAIMS
jgi:hypothetical protein